MESLLISIPIWDDDQQISNQRHLLCTKQWVCPRIIPQKTISGKDMER